MTKTTTQSVKKPISGRRLQPLIKKKAITTTTPISDVIEMVTALQTENAECYQLAIDSLEELTKTQEKLAKQKEEWYQSTIDSLEKLAKTQEKLAKQKAKRKEDQEKCWLALQDDSRRVDLPRVDKTFLNNDPDVTFWIKRIEIFKDKVSWGDLEEVKLTWADNCHPSVPNLSGLKINGSGVGFSGFDKVFQIYTRFKEWKETEHGFAIVKIVYNL